jgi:hypothetical protein
MPPAAAARRSLCPAIWPGARRATRGSATRPDPPSVEEIVAVVRQAGDVVMAPASGRSSRCCGGRACASPRRSPSPSTTSSPAPGRADTGPPRQGRPPPRGRHGPVGLGTPPSLARAPDGNAGRPPAVRDRRPNPRPAVGERLSPRPTAARRRQGRRGGGSPRTRSATPTPSSSRTRGSRSTSFSANWGIPTSASPLSICKGSTTPRSSPPSTPGKRR